MSPLESFSPTTGELLGSVPTTEPERVQAVVDEVAAVQPAWAALPIRERSRHLRRAGEVALAQIDELAALVTREQGKPRNESYVMELVPTIDALHWIAGHAHEILSDEEIRDQPLFTMQKRARVRFEPLGVVGVIAPWNYPWSIPFGEVATALACGNGVVLKPSPLTPLTGQRIQDVFERAGLPAGLVRAVHGGGAVGQALVESTTAKIFFTGSVEVGRSVGVACAERMKGSVLELGGKDPAIVLSDASMANAVAGVIWGGFANAGQTCSGIERAYVSQGAADPFVARLVRGAERMKVGDPMEWDTEVGPMVSADHLERVHDLVEDAVAAGATMHCGGPVRVAGLAGHFYAPTVLTGVTAGMRIMREEVFGPVLPVCTVGSEEEAVGLANDSRFGLGASVWTLDRAKGERMASLLQSGMVWINDHSYSHGTHQAPWGGVKDSGLGRAHSRFGLHEHVEVKLVAWDPSRVPNFWWHPYDSSLGRGAQAAARLIYGRDGDRRRALAEGAVPLVKLGAKLVRGALRG
ncbi:MAG: aldehyde dehydrogenase family protein [Actinomycetota bacterium]|nr:aldehyde dehydrogenase family protein [Actinomycetota bacterium]